MLQQHRLTLQPILIFTDAYLGPIQVQPFQQPQQERHFTLHWSKALSQQWRSHTTRIH